MLLGRFRSKFYFSFPGRFCARPGLCVYRFPSSPPLKTTCTYPQPWSVAMAIAMAMAMAVAMAMAMANGVANLLLTAAANTGCRPGPHWRCTAAGGPRCVQAAAPWQPRWEVCQPPSNWHGRDSDIHTYLPTYLHTYMHASMHVCMHAYTCMYTYRQTERHILID